MKRPAGLFCGGKYDYCCIPFPADLYKQSTCKYGRLTNIFLSSKMNDDVTLVLASSWPMCSYVSPFHSRKNIANCFLKSDHGKHPGGHHPESTNLTIAQVACPTAFQAVAVAEIAHPHLRVSPQDHK